MFRSILRLASILLLGLGLSTEARADILVLSSGNNQLVRFTDAGAFVSSTSLGSGSTLSDIEVDSLGNHYISRFDGSIRKYDSSLAFVGSFGSFSPHYGLGIDSADRIHIAGSGSSVVRVTNSSGSLLETYGTNPSNYRDIAFVGNERWVTSFGKGVHVFDSSGTYQRTIATGFAPFGISEAIGGGAWVLHQNSHVVNRIDAAGSIVFSFNADSTPLPPTLGQVRYIETDVFGRVLVSAYASKPRRRLQLGRRVPILPESRAEPAHRSVRGASGCGRRARARDGRRGGVRRRRGDVGRPATPIELKLRANFLRLRPRGSDERTARWRRPHRSRRARASTARAR